MTLPRPILLGTVLLAARLAGAYINPRFTPVELVRQAECVAVVRLHGDRCTVVTALKGSVEGEHALVVSVRDEDQATTLRRVLAAGRDDPAVLFAAGKQGLLRLNGNWLQLAPDGDRRWRITGFAQEMSGVYAGGTDMLVRMTRYILSEPDASVPARVGTRWFDRVALGRIQGATGMAVVPLESGQMLFVASTRGDHLFRPKGDDAFEEEQLETRSSQSAWLDWDDDGRADLATWDGTALCVRDKVVFRGTCFGLAPFTGGLLVSTTGLPILVRPSGRTERLAGGQAVAAAGKMASACVAADLDNDGFPDVLQPRERGGVLWRGRAGGFHTPAPSPVCSPAGGARTAVGDFDGDGALDVFLGDAKGNQLWENDGKGAFHAVTGSACSLSYKMPTGIAACLATDLDHDGRTDLAVAYPDSAFAYHFNRGFRCFGELGELRLTGGAFEGGPPPGARHLAAGDLNADGGLDLAVVFTGGELFVYWNHLTDAPMAVVRLPKGTPYPVTVSAWQDHDHAWCVGTYRVWDASLPTAIPLRQTGTCLLRYRVAGQPARSMTVKVGKQPVAVVLETQ
jgi:hypothetical protein